jgi:hypothetical protein
MPRPAPSGLAAAGRAVRIARAVAAALAVGAAVAGCTVAVDGRATAHVDPHAPGTALPVPDLSVPTAPTGPIGGAEVYAEWIASGWSPQPMLPVSEPDSGVSAWMFGTAERRPDDANGGVGFQSLVAPASVVSWFGVFPVPEGYVADALQGARGTATAKNGQVISSEPVAVRGHPGLDVRIEFRTAQGQDMVDLIRYVELPGHLAGIESVGLRSDERVLRQVHQIMVGGLTVPQA